MRASERGCNRPRLRDEAQPVPRTEIKDALAGTEPRGIDELGTEEPKR